MSALTRSTVALFLSASLAVFGVGCVTEETIDDDVEELDVDAEDELEEGDGLEDAQASDEPAPVEIAQPTEGLDPSEPSDEGVDVPPSFCGTDELLLKVGCQIEGGVWAAGVCILPPRDA